MQCSNIFNPPLGYKVKIGDETYQCSIGKGGIREDKREGDGATPAGNFMLRRVFYRPDRITREEIKTELPIQALSQNDGWCDDINYTEYNTLIKIPFSGSYEELWREDHLYDLVIVVGYNDEPVEKNKGSAIFMHIAREGYKPTAGCIGFKKEDLLDILPCLSSKTSIKISKTGGLEFENYTKCINSLRAVYF